MTTPVYSSLWAKTNRENNGQTHPLICHLIDVGECILALWKDGLSQQTRITFSDLLGVDIDKTGNLLAFWGSLHDLGKAAPGFQRKYLPIIPILEKEGFVFPTPALSAAPHGIMSTWAVMELLPSETGLSKKDARKIAFALGGHHGAWPTNDRLQSPALQNSDKGTGRWDEARREIFLTLKEIYQPVQTVILPAEEENQAELNTFLTLFSGLVSVADWIGSMAEHFPFAVNVLPLNYVAKSRLLAGIALNDLGWIGWQPDGRNLSFAEMFPQASIPRDIQAHTIEAGMKMDLPALVILEAPTGIGKTEAALYLANNWLEKCQGKGIYIAMPTQATSNQMYERFVDFLQNRYPDQNITTHLVHGMALLEEAWDTRRQMGVAQDDGSLSGNVNAESWFLPRKRTMLSPFGVGTVDQALMSVLQTNHFFVRMFGLGQKVVIFDEVHAYDTYMSTLFQRLLRWLRSIGTSVILLSATLPDSTRHELVRAWMGDQQITLQEVPYPRLTTVSAGNVACLPLPSPQASKITLTWIGQTPEQIADHLAEKIKLGGCIAIICNRVQRAQEIYAAIKARELVDPQNLILFHARFPFQWREIIEKRVLSIFGKHKDHPNQPNPDRPRRAIVVATQVIEQSLDLDFDYMITDLAPVDLLLQRAGRLHRHRHNDLFRPEGLHISKLAIALPELRDALPNFALDSFVYDDSTLLRTWQTLHELNQLVLPEQTAALIESVYGSGLDETLFSSGFSQALKRSDLKNKKQLAVGIEQALSRLIRYPEDEFLLTRTTKQLEEDDSQVGATFRALTRLAEPGVALICLHETTAGIALEPDGLGAPVLFDKIPNGHLTRQLLRRVVNVQRRDIVNYFTGQTEGMGLEWAKSAALRFHYSVVFDKNGEFHPVGSKFMLKISQEVGLQIIAVEDK